MGIQINGNTDNITATDGGLSITSLEINQTGISTFQAGVNVSGGQLDVGSNIKIGTAGVVTATSFSGSGANLTSLPSQATIANNADNRVITGGSGVNLNGEANFTFDGTIATIQNSGAVYLNLGSTNAGGATITLDGDSNGDFSGNDYSTIKHSTDGHLVLHTKNPAGASNVFIQMGTSNHYGAMFKEGAESLLRYNNSTKIETTNTGAVVTGICTATSFSGDGSNLTGITGTTINNNADNKVITGSGSANTLEAESSFTHNGSSQDTIIEGSQNTPVDFIIRNTNNSQNAAGARLNIEAGDNGNNGAQLVLEQNGAYHTLESRANGTFYLSNNGTTALTLDNSNNMHLSLGSFVIGTAGEGLSFQNNSGSASGSSSALLDDYEEGTYTPVVTGDTGTANSADAQGAYTKIGRLVTVNIKLNLSNKNGISGAVYVSLPFTVADTLGGTSLESNGVCVYFQNIAASSFLGLNTISGVAKARFGGVESKQVTSSTIISSGDISDNFDMRGTISYFT